MLPALLFLTVFAPTLADEDVALSVTAAFRAPTAELADDGGPRLSTLGVDRLEPVFDALVLGFLDADATRLRTTSEEREALVEDLGTLPRGTVLRFLEAKLDRPASVASSEAALRLLGTYGESRHLQPMVAAVTAEPELLRAFEDGATDLLRRERGAVARVRWSWGDATPALRGALLHALGSCGQNGALDLMLQFLSWEDEEASAVIACLQRLLSELGPARSAEVAPVLRGYLSADDTETVKAACLALGQLADRESIEAVLRLLESEDRGVRANAHWSLQAMTGERFSANPGPWRRWLDQERAWFRERQRPLIEQLRDRRDEQVVAALQELQRHALFEADFRWEVIDALAHTAPEVRAVACRVAATHAGPEALPYLVELLSDPVPAVVQAAHHALRTQTGFELETDARAWFAALEADGSLR